MVPRTHSPYCTQDQLLGGGNFCQKNFQQNLYQNFLDFSRFELSIKSWKLKFYPPPPTPLTHIGTLGF